MSEHGTSRYVRVDGHYLAGQARTAFRLFFAPFKVWERRGGDAGRYVEAMDIASHRPGRSRAR